MQLQSSSFKLETTPTEAVQAWLVKQLAQQLNLDAKTINVTEPLTRYGLDSIDAVTIVGDLEDSLDLELPSTLFWDHPTIEKSAQYLTENFELTAILERLVAGEPECSTPAQQAPEPNTNDKKGWGNLFGRLKA
jgi:acyl carrier protein